MKIHLLPNGFVMVGKAWEIRAKLKEYNRSFETVEQWVNSTKSGSALVKNDRYTNKG